MSASPVLDRTDSMRASLMTRLLITDRGSDGLYRPVGFLDARNTTRGPHYSFAYLQRALEQSSFRPLLGFSDVTRRYESDGLFPLFAERLMDPRRPDRPVYLAALDLSEDASPLEVLARSGGRRAGDGIELTPVPAVSRDGATTCTFLVHGIRHVPGAAQLIDGLTAGDTLRLRAEVDNPVNPRALLVSEGTGAPLGWVPGALVDYVHRVAVPQLTAVRVNGPEVGTRLRLLVRLTGVTDVGYQPFAGSDWATAA